MTLDDIRAALAPWDGEMSDGLAVELEAWDEDGWLEDPDTLGDALAWVAHGVWASSCVDWLLTMGYSAADHRPDDMDDRMRLAWVQGVELDPDALRDAFDAASE